MPAFLLCSFFSSTAKWNDEPRSRYFRVLSPWKVWCFHKQVLTTIWSPWLICFAIWICKWPCIVSLSIWCFYSLLDLVFLLAGIYLNLIKTVSIRIVWWQCEKSTWSSYDLFVVVLFYSYVTLIDLVDVLVQHNWYTKVSTYGSVWWTWIQYLVQVL